MNRITDARYAFFWERLCAGLIDGVIVGVVYGVVYFITLANISAPHGDPATYGAFANGITYVYETLATYYTNFIMIFAVLLYHTIMEASPLQASIGKLTLGLRVVDLNGNRIGYGRSLVRSFFREWLLCILTQPFTKRRQGLQDLISGCLVVKQPITVLNRYIQTGTHMTSRPPPLSKSDTTTSHASQTIPHTTITTPSTLTATPPHPDLQDRDLYALAYQECQGDNPNRDPGIWAMALSRTDGDVNRCQAEYIRHRVAFLHHQNERRHVQQHETPLHPNFFAKIKSFEKKNRGPFWSILCGFALVVFVLGTYIDDELSRKHREAREAEASARFKEYCEASNINISDTWVLIRQDGSRHILKLIQEKSILAGTIDNYGGTAYSPGRPYPIEGSIYGDGSLSFDVKTGLPDPGEDRYYPEHRFRGNIHGTALKGDGWVATRNK